MILTEVLNGSDPVLTGTDTVCSSQRSNCRVGQGGSDDVPGWEKKVRKNQLGRFCFIN